MDTVTPGPLTKGALERKNSAEWALAKVDSEGERASRTGITSHTPLAAITLSPNITLADLAWCGTLISGGFSPLYFSDPILSLHPPGGVSPDPDSYLSYNVACALDR